MLERWFQRDQLVVFGAVVGGLTIIAVIVTVVVAGSAQSEPQTSRAAADPPLPSGRIVGVGASDIVFPRQSDDGTPLEFRRFREPLARWQQEQIDRFWIDPQSIAADYLVKENDRLMEELFDTIP
jgi:hypothetical protein